MKNATYTIAPAIAAIAPSFAAALPRDRRISLHRPLIDAPAIDGPVGAARWSISVGLAPISFWSWVAAAAKWVSASGATWPGPTTARVPAARAAAAGFCFGAGADRAIAAGFGKATAGTGSTVTVADE